MPPALQAIVLDFDGVVLESNEVKTEAFRGVFARFPAHLEAAMAFHFANAWKSRYEKIDFLLDRLGRPGDAALREELAREFSERVLRQIETVPFVTGAKEFLEEFSRRVPLHVASVTPQEDIERTIRQRDLMQFFSGVYGCPPWTKPTAIHDVLRRGGYSAARVVLVGDAPGDRSAATEAGIGFVARRSRIPFDDPIPTLYADLTEVGDALRPRLA
ncbi:MAG: HAD hydrolase-like protein [Gemmatimonadetes bacterium]|nr:HAD hydrolase-like protein [Gemmatimonadota bacterium]